LRPYGTVSPQFWTGKTGKKLRADRDAQVIAVYLMTSPHSHQTGLYYLPLMYLSHETGIPIEGAKKALSLLDDDGFCRYDHQAEWVWVCEMAAWQIGTSLKDTDKRALGVQSYLESVPDLHFVGDFIARYQGDFHLHPVDNTRPYEGASKGHTLIRTGTEQEQNRTCRAEPDGDLLVLNGHPADSPTDAIARVFAHWQTQYSKPRAKLDDKRRKAIRNALAAYPEPDVIAAISGYKNSPHHMGKNERHTVYDDIELFLRDAKHIDAGLAFAKQTGAGQWM
jgi:hypothetical protein